MAEVWGGLSDKRQTVGVFGHASGAEMTGFTSAAVFKYCPMDSYNEAFGYFKTSKKNWVARAGKNAVKLNNSNIPIIFEF